MLSLSKCRDVVNYYLDNGRILQADQLETTVTDIDWDILNDCYQFEAEILDIWQTKYAPLPEPLRALTIDYYDRKTRLKGVVGEELQYDLSKALLNSIYGMMAYNPCKPDLFFDGAEFEVMPLDIQGKLDANLNRAFLVYAWGVWVTAWARLRLYEGIKIAGAGFVYCDTDSVKYLGDADFTAYNKQRITDSTYNGAYATDPAGITHYMGVFEEEKPYDQFRTWGAKKYGFDQAGHLGITVAGVAKKKGAKELSEKGGLEEFKPGFVFKAAGGLETVYNDRVDFVLTYQGHEIHIVDNVYLRPSTYQLGVTLEYDTLLHDAASMDYIMADFMQETNFINEGD